LRKREASKKNDGNMPHRALAGELGQPDRILAGVFEGLIQDLEAALLGSLAILFPPDPFGFGRRG
jgi:hypothetical protein